MPNHKLSNYYVPRAQLGDDADADLVARCIAAGGSAESCASASMATGSSVLANANTGPAKLQPWQVALQQQGQPSSTAQTAGGIIGGLLSVFAPKPAYPMLPPGYMQPGMSDTTKIVLAGGAAVALVFLLRRKSA